MLVTLITLIAPVGNSNNPTLCLCGLGFPSSVERAYEGIEGYKGPFVQGSRPWTLSL